MNRFYNVTITKRRFGSAIEHLVPPLEGTVAVSVFEVATNGNHRLFVVDATDTQHKKNQVLPGVEVLKEAQAIKLAAQYQPARTLTRFEPEPAPTSGPEPPTRFEPEPSPRFGRKPPTMKEVKIPAMDLTKFITKP